MDLSIPSTNRVVTMSVLDERIPHADLAERILVNLGVLSHVKYGQKLTTPDGYHIEIDADGLFQPLRRWWFEDSQRKTIELLRQLQHDARRCVSYMVEEARKHRGTTCSRVYVFLSRVAELIALAVIGLENLCKTYKDSMLTRSTVQTFMKSFEELAEQIRVELPGLVSIAS